ncbi:MAG: bifunctional folylpolyglutamate synthase/dihydrofolate synthase, partial [Clostridia bacterium]
MAFDVQGYLRSLTRFGMKPGLQRIKAILGRLGHPEAAFPAVHIGGTNGKGSTAAMTAAILQRAGYRVGLY